MSPDTQPTKEAVAKAQTILLSVDWCFCRSDTIHRVCDTHRYIAAALDAYAAEMGVRVGTAECEAALRASRERLTKIGEWAHPDGIDAECYLCGETHGRNASMDAECPCPAHALGEE